MQTNQPPETEVVPKVNPAPVDPSAMSVYDIAMAFEQGKMDPVKVEKDVLIECALVYRSKRYPISQIAAILKVDSRTVSRYVAEARKNNAIKANPFFQAEFVGDSLNNLWAQYARLIRWSYSDELSESDKIRAALSACQIQKYAIELMERLGYLSKANTEAATKINIASMAGRYEVEELANVDLLNEEQLQRLNSVMIYEQFRMASIVDKTVAEMLDKKSPAPFEFTPKDINIELLKNNLSKRSSTNYDRIVLKRVGILDLKDKVQLDDISGEQLMSAFNGVLQMPGFAKDTGASFSVKDFSPETRLLVSQFAGNSKIKKHELMNLNARLLTEYYNKEINDCYFNKLVLWEKKYTE